MNYLNEFVRWLREEGRSKSTIRAYTRVLKNQSEERTSLSDWYEDTTGQPFDPKKITALDLHDYKRYLEKKLEPATVNKYIAALKTFWTFLLEAEYVTDNPTAKVKMKSSTQVIDAPRWLDRKDQERLIQAVATEKNEWKRARNLAIIQTMLQAGLRIGEVRDLNLKDVDMRHEMITVRSGKGGKYRTVPMNPDLWEAMDAWLKIRGELELNEEAVFLSERKKRMTDRAILYALKKYLKLIGKPDATAHSLRHSFCKNLADQGWEIDYIARLAGHSHIQTTARYKSPGEQDMKKMVQSISSKKKRGN